MGKTILVYACFFLAGVLVHKYWASLKVLFGNLWSKVVARKE